MAGCEGLLAGEAVFGRLVAASEARTSARDRFRGEEVWGLAGESRLAAGLSDMLEGVGSCSESLGFGRGGSVSAERGLDDSASLRWLSGL